MRLLSRIAARKRPAIDWDFCQLVRRFYAPFVGYYANTAGDFYENRGQIEQALAEWQAAQRLDNEDIDSKACQALLKSVNATAEERLGAQRLWAKKHALKPRSGFETPSIEAYPGRRISLAYACAWWDSSTIRGQAIPFISKHDRSKFRVIAYSRDACDKSITQHFDEFRVIRKMSNEEFVRLVQKDKIDVLVEFTGFSPHNRYGAMGARCAPVQISYLNHAGTCGVDSVDYVVADEIAAPLGTEQFYTERIIRLPGTFFNFNYDWDRFPDSGPPPSMRNGYVTFGCFGSQSKINDAQIYMWAKLLRSIPNSVLFLRNRGLNSERDRAFMTRRFGQWGIEASRLRLEPGGARESILESYSEVDISLDTWPYNGGNTIAESLWQGVPVLTILGNSFASRYGASLLKASGCERFVARHIGELIRLALDVAQDKELLARLRRDLRRMMKEFGFADSDRFCRVWEHAMEQTVLDAIAGAPKAAA